MGKYSLQNDLRALLNAEGMLDTEIDKLLFTGATDFKLAENKVISWVHRGEAVVRPKVTTSGPVIISAPSIAVPAGPTTAAVATVVT